MAVLGSIETKLDLRGYAQDPMHALAEQFVDTARAAHQESGLDIFGEPGRFMKDQFTKGEMKKFFTENSFDPKDPKFQNPEVFFLQRRKRRLPQAAFLDQKAVIQTFRLRTEHILHIRKVQHHSTALARFLQILFAKFCLYGPTMAVEI